MDFSQIGAVEWIAIGAAVVLQLTLQVLAFLDLMKRPGAWEGRKLVWLIVIFVTEMLGPLLYFAWGKGTFPVAEEADAPAADTVKAASAVDALYGAPAAGDRPDGDD
ncbi:MAG: PLDc_N domain-containing protein [Actinobacteria bacterium]|nr:MAG: PLDc_N domain-containing protein [Actinomycetota bacterium]